MTRSSKWSTCNKQYVCNVKLSLDAITHQDLKAHGGKVQLHILTSAADGLWSVSHTGRFIPEKEPQVISEERTGWAKERDVHNSKYR